MLDFHSPDGFSLKALQAHYRATRARLMAPPRLKRIERPSPVTTILRSPKAAVDPAQPQQPPPDPICDEADAVRPLTTHRIIREVARFYGITAADIRGVRRTHPLARARQITCYLARMHTANSLPAIARHVRRDHTTVIHAVGKFEHLVATDPDTVSEIAELRVRLDIPDC